MIFDPRVVKVHNLVIINLCATSPATHSLIPSRISTLVMLPVIGRPTPRFSCLTVSLSERGGGVGDPCGRMLLLRQLRLPLRVCAGELELSQPGSPGDACVPHCSALCTPTCQDLQASLHPASPAFSCLVSNKLCSIPINYHSVSASGSDP
ncbi:unnamed protein product [Pleuronectes platessa]|uniref:Uncharacterized protein n=1 Tax=Pleuronectes platessa TaxID=8262 RepID=A0A9N7VTX1_PLEPL|nr:unnamed protein product [Pleuronectes platessa]